MVGLCVQLRAEDVCHVAIFQRRDSRRNNVLIFSPQRLQLGVIPHFSVRGRVVLRRVKVQEDYAKNRAANPKDSKTDYDNFFHDKFWLPPRCVRISWLSSGIFGGENLLFASVSICVYLWLKICHVDDAPH
jgi:hypothetical protein